MEEQQTLKNGESDRKIKILSPYDFIDKIKIKIKKEWKIAFLATIIIGLITHMFIMVNNLPNHDGLVNIVGNQEHIELGRWFLKFACLFSSYFTIPWIIGIVKYSSNFSNTSCISNNCIRICLYIYIRWLYDSIIVS